MVAADAPVGRSVLDGDAVHQHPVERSIAGFEGGADGAGQLAEGVVERDVGEIGIEAREGLAEAGGEGDVGVG